MGHLINNLSKSNSNISSLSNTHVQNRGRGRNTGSMRKKIKMNEVDKLTSSVMYLVLPSFAEPHKHTIKKILEAEKAKIRMNSRFKKCFDAIEFKIAFTNSKNIKQLIVRTKI